MPRIEYIGKRFSAKGLAMIAQANSIIEEYDAAGFVLTLRQLYYQFVARGLLANKHTEYTRLGRTVNDARLAGLIDWNAIEDRTRYMRRNSHWDNPSHIIDNVAQSYLIDMWADQEYRPEVWIEKDALVGVIEGVCIELDVPYFACRGYTSQSEQWRAGIRMRRHAENGQTPVVIHLGDHDPSGIDMTRDNEDRLGLFFEDFVEVKRLALNWDQVKQYRPPPNPAKVTDARFAEYERRFGHQCWELDALDPKVIATLVREQIMSMIDYTRWGKSLRKLNKDKKMFKALSKRWKEVTTFLNGGK